MSQKHRRYFQNIIKCIQRIINSLQSLIQQFESKYKRMYPPNQRKKVPCSFKGKCRNFVAKQPCKFSHDPCPYGSKCRFGDKCSNYHPEIDANNPNRSEISRNTLPPQRGPKNMSGSRVCKYGNTCHKKATGQCPFLHEEGSVNPLTDTNRSQLPEKIKALPCKFGDTCLKFRTGNCTYRHDGENVIQQDNRPIFSSRPSATNNYDSRPVSNNRPHDPSSFNRPVASQRFNFQTEICPDFMFNRCQAEQFSCPNRKKHLFTKDNTLKRLFYSGKAPLSLLQTCKLLYIDRATYYVFHSGNALLFMKFNEVSSAMEKVTDNLLQQNSNILALTTEESTIMYAKQVPNGYEIAMYKPRQGEIQRLVSSHKHQIFALVPLRNNVLLSVAKNELVNVWLENELTSQGTNKFNIPLVAAATTLNFIKKVPEVMDQCVIVGGTELGKICLWNKTLDYKMIQNLSPKQVVDAESYAVNGHPFCILTAIDTEKMVSQIITIDLINCSATVVAELKTEARKEQFKKLIIIRQLLFVQLSTGNVYIYKLPDLRERAGIIAFTNEIASMEKDREDRLVILESKSANSEGSFSIFKLNP